MEKKKFNLGNMQKLKIQDDGLINALMSYIKNPAYILCIIATAIANFGFFLTHTTISVDLLSYDRYDSTYFFAQGRFTAPIVAKFISLIEDKIQPDFCQDFIGIVLLIIGIMVFSHILYSFLDTDSIVPAIIFGCIYISYPLSCEYYCYGTSLSAGVCVLLTSLALYFMLKSNSFLKGNIISIVLLMIMLSYYEAYIVVYIAMVFAILIIEVTKSRHTQTELFFSGMTLSFAPVLAVILEILATKVLLLIMNNNLPSMSMTYSNWLHDYGSFKYLFGSYLSYWVAKFFCYTPFTILFIAIAIAVIMCILQVIKYKKPMLIIFYGGLISTLFIFSFIRCGDAGYRVEQEFFFFISFIFMFMSAGMIKSGKAYLKAITGVAMTAVILLQVLSSNHWYQVNHMRYAEEKQMAYDITYTINHDFDSSKPVVFIGEYRLSDNITERIKIKEGSVAERIFAKGFELMGYANASKANYIITDTAVLSYFEWGDYCFKEANTELYKFFEYHSCEPVHCTKKQYFDAVNRYSDINTWPEQGSIVENDEYIVVKLGDVDSAFITDNAKQ